VAFGVSNPELGTEDVALVAEVDLPDLQAEDGAAYRAVEDAVRLAVHQSTAVSLKYIRLVNQNWLIKTSSGKIARAANREKFLSELS
jgi:hypothetical protein